MATRFNLNRLRTDLGLKQSDIAEVLQIPQSSVSAMENWKTNVSQAYVNTLVHKFGISNIQDYYEEYESINVTNNSGSGNGTNNKVQIPGSSDPLVLARLTSIEKDVDTLSGRTQERIEKLENKVDELERENKQLLHQLTEFKILCAKKGIDYEVIIG